MKALYRISLFFFVFALVFFLYATMKADRAKEYRKENRKESVTDALDRPESLLKIKAESIDSVGASDSITPVLQKETTLSGQTVYEVSSVNEATGQVHEEITSIPPKYIGMNREELVEELKNYQLAPSLEDLEKGFQSISLTSFSAEKIIVEKIYQPPVEEKQEPYFFLVAENHKITVYQENTNQVYLYTEISLDSLPESLRNEILDTKYVEGEAELYNFLESYSS